MDHTRVEPSGGGADLERSADVAVAIAHDYLSERGGAERVVLSLTRAFPEAPIYTSLFHRPSYPELEHVDVRASPLNAIGPLRSRHRAALPLLPWAYGRMRIEADVVVCSSSGWSHGAGTDAPKLVYCYNPPRWVYQRIDYVRSRHRYWFASRALDPYLRRWDQRAAASCARYVAISGSVAQRIREIYGREAEVVPPPTTFDATGPVEPVADLEPGFVLSVGRLLAYKNVHQVIEAVRRLPGQRLVVVGTGSYEHELARHAPKNVHFTGRVSDAQLRWLYANCSMLVSASNEDFGLTPVEAALFGKPSALLRGGGFLDTAVEGTTGLFFDHAEPDHIRDTVLAVLDSPWSTGEISALADRYSEAGFARRMRELVVEVARTGS